MTEMFNAAIRNVKYGYKNNNPTQKEFMETFKNFYSERVATTRNKEPTFTWEEALSRARVVWADDMA